jgi:hypothetical protein
MLLDGAFTDRGMCVALCIAVSREMIDEAGGDAGELRPMVILSVPRWQDE